MLTRLKTRYLHPSTLLEEAPFPSMRPANTDAGNPTNQCKPLSRNNINKAYSWFKICDKRLMLQKSWKTSSQPPGMLVETWFFSKIKLPFPQLVFTQTAPIENHLSRLTKAPLLCFWPWKFLENLGVFSMESSQQPCCFSKINRFELKCCLEFQDCKSRKIIETSLTNKVQEKHKWDSGIDSD